VRSGAPLTLREGGDSSRMSCKMFMVLGSRARRALPACAFLPAFSLDRFGLHFSTCSDLVASPMTDRRLHGPCGNQYPQMWDLVQVTLLLLVGSHLPLLEGTTDV
jgi:hypothetical protein